MGIWDFINSSTDKLKQNAPSLTPVTAACRSSYSFSRNAVTKVNTAVTGTVVPTLNHYVAEEEGRAKIGRFATSFVKNAAFYGFHEGLKWIPDSGRACLSGPLLGRKLSTLEILFRLRAKSSVTDHVLDPPGRTTFEDEVADALEFASASERWPSQPRSIKT